MSILVRNLLILLVISLAMEPSKAHHNSSHKGTNTSANVNNEYRQTTRNLTKYQKEVLFAFNSLREKAAEIWGDEDAIVPNIKTDVTYRENLKQRSIVDYEEGTVKVELALGAEKARNLAMLERKLADAVVQTILQGADERSIIEIANSPTPPDSQKSPALAGLIENHDGKPLTDEDIPKFKKSKVLALIKRSITGKDGQKRILISTQFKLVPDHIKIRAEKYRVAVDFHAHKNGIPTPLIYAIMETESFFNPTAKSPVPAFGLMQLVPEAGARDAYRFLKGKDKIVKDTYLYNSTNNIELGAAYLHILYFRYLKHIKDPTSKLWATIAAYNTGTQNVFKSFAGEYTESNHVTRWLWKNRALKKINNMKPEEVYRHLHLHLPYEETRLYMQKVRKRMGKYII